MEKEELEGVARVKHAFNFEWEFARREPFIFVEKNIPRNGATLLVF